MLVGVDFTNLALGAPTLRARGGFTSERWFLPAAMECRVGAEMLTALKAQATFRRSYRLRIHNAAGNAVKSASNARTKADEETMPNFAQRRQVGERERQKTADVNESREYDRAASYQQCMS